MSPLPASVFGQIDTIVEATTRSGEADFFLPASVVSHFERAGLEADEVDRIVGPRKEIAKLVRLQKHLSTDQTDRASRLAHIVSLSERVFGKREKAFMWLRLPNAIFGGRRPLELLTREAGARLVEEALLQIEYGVYA